MRRALLLLLAFGYAVLLFEALRTTYAWWQGELAPGWPDYLLVAVLPLLAWIWWRRFSMFRRDCSSARCDTGKK